MFGTHITRQPDCPSIRVRRAINLDDEFASAAGEISDVRSHDQLLISYACLCSRSRKEEIQAVIHPLCSQRW